MVNDGFIRNFHHGCLIDRGQILDFTPGPGAVSFGIVVVLTMFAAESLDSRLIWDNYEQRK